MAPRPVQHPGPAAGAPGIGAGPGAGVTPYGTVPPLPGWVIARPRLLERVRKGARGRLTVVTGPPGSGKTVAVHSWAATEERSAIPIVWMSGDRMPGTPQGFHAVLAECLARSGTVPGPHVQGPQAGTAGLLAALETPVVLVLDDFRPERGSALIGLVSGLLEHAGPGLRVVVTTRSDPPFPLRRYALAGRLTEIRADDLAFGEREIAAVLAQHGVRLGPAPLRALAERTEGWAAGVRLAAMSMELQPDPESFVERFAGDDHAVVGYLVEEVLDAQPAGVRRLLLATSVTDRVNAELATELTGDEIGRGFAELVRRNAFVMPLGHGWYRQQTMIREALRLVLDHEAPGEADALCLRAARWFERAGHLPEAVRQAARAGDWEYAARMVVDRLAIGGVLGLRPADPLAELFGAMPAGLAFAAAEPEPAIVAAAVGVARGDDRACATALQHAGRLLERAPGRVQARLCAAFVRLARHRPTGPAGTGAPHGEVPVLLPRFPERLLDDRPELRALVLSARAAAALRAGRSQEAARLFGTAAAAATQAGGDFQRRHCLGHLALIEALHGRFAHAAELAARAEQLPEVSVSPAGRRVPAAHLASAWVRLERYEAKAAADELDRAGRALDACPDPLMAAVRRLIGARLEIARERPDQALRTLGTIGGSAPRAPWIERRLRLVAAEAHAARGAAGPARVAAEQAGGAATPRSAVALARAEVCGGDPAAAAGALRHALTESANVPADVRIEAWLLHARLAYSAEDASGGRRFLDRALRLAERERIRLPFALCGEWLPQVLRHDPDLARPYRSLLGPLRPGDRAEPSRPDGAVPVERLSPRESDVLQRLAGMMSTEEIAADLCLSVNTIKTHLKNIYRKLGVTRRTEAVRRARSLSLLRDR
ncbi:LuxR family transcriptional regulator [Actinomadura viridis]|uniref:LuxR family maltose regulon positive regulatory protein n=1 Tax=Actinomadura viridis TaxID=58110 RepID=A0A931DS26_9ACTN|nr:LuxR C-terminal-related transcriptional regulator [Actinomadura viridis]MBG6092385.1 LuxR family maltose regulon positive regulatory protein [Actinomadura viridis]